LSKEKELGTRKRMDFVIGKIERIELGNEMGDVDIHSMEI